MQRHHVNNVFKKEHLIFVFYDGRKIVILATIFHIINQQTFPILDMHLHIYSDFVPKILLAYTALCIFFVTVILLNFLRYNIFLTKIHLYINWKGKVKKEKRKDSMFHIYVSILWMSLPFIFALKSLCRIIIQEMAVQIEGQLFSNTIRKS